MSNEAFAQQLAEKIWLYEDVNDQEDLKAIILRALNAETPHESYPASYKLPCDVLIPPAARFCKGVELKTLMLGLKHREGIDAPPFTQARLESAGFIGNTQPASASGPDWIKHNGRWQELKTDSTVYCAVDFWLKPYEIRFDDRGYQVGDGLRLRETLHTGEEMKAGAPLIYTGRVAERIVCHILRGPVYGLAEGWVILSFLPAAFAAPAQPAEAVPSDVQGEVRIRKLLDVLCDAEFTMGELSERGESHVTGEKYDALLIKSGKATGEIISMLATPAPAVSPAVPEGYSWSPDDERYQGEFASRDDAVADARRHYGEDMPLTVFTAKNVPHEPSFESAAEAAMETLQCQADDECGECAEDWNVMDKAVREAAAEAISAIVTRMAPPTFWTVTDVQRHEIAAPAAEVKPS